MGDAALLAAQRDWLQARVEALEGVLGVLIAEVLTALRELAEPTSDGGVVGVTLGQAMARARAVLMTPNAGRAAELRGEIPRGGGAVVTMASPERVTALVEELVACWGGLVGPDVSLVDGLMALHNFHKWGIDHIVAQGVGDPEAAASLYETALATFAGAMHERSRKVRGGH